MKKELSERKTTRLNKFNYSRNGAYFITICTKDRRCLLSKIVETGVLDGPSAELTEYGKIADKYINQLNDFYDDISVEKYVIMPNHIHVLLLITENGPSRMPVSTMQNSIISRFISTLKRFCNKEYGENVWQNRSYDHIIRNRDDYIQHIKYIHENPMSWYYDELYTEQ